LEQFVYVATPQRLDQNTTGLLVVATKKSFAAYFAKLLRTKVSSTRSLPKDDLVSYLRRDL
jgi:23S rRNA-/tRNA-specific pseudouridylate synthase